MKRIFFIIFTIMLMSCNKDSEQDWTGMEYFDFEISGKVTDNAGTAIKGINVSASGSQAQSGEDGSYVLKGRGGSSTEVTVNFVDLDLDDNGGLFAGESVKVSLEYVKGRHGPYLGLFTKKGVDAVLVPGRVPVSDKIPEMQGRLP